MLTRTNQSDSNAVESLQIKTHENVIGRNKKKITRTNKFT